MLTGLAASILNGGQLKKKEFAPLGGNSFLYELTCNCKANRKSQELFLFLKVAEKQNM